LSSWGSSEGWGDVGLWSQTADVAANPVHAHVQNDDDSLENWGKGPRNGDIWGTTPWGVDLRISYPETLGADHRAVPTAAKETTSAIPAGGSQ
jgi:hypothetical protein